MQSGMQRTGIKGREAESRMQRDAEDSHQTTPDTNLNRAKEIEDTRATEIEDRHGFLDFSNVKIDCLRSDYPRWILITPTGNLG